MNQKLFYEQICVVVEITLFATFCTKPIFRLVWRSRGGSKRWLCDHHDHLILFFFGIGNSKHFRLYKTIKRYQG